MSPPWVIPLGFAPWAHYHLTEDKALEYRGRAAASVLVAAQEQGLQERLTEPCLVAVVWVGIRRSPTQEVLERALRPVVTALRKHATAPLMVSFAWRAGEKRDVELVIRPRENR